jgi:hypothetical protein
MATATDSNNIRIHFRAEGEQELKRAITSLSAATDQLKNSQMQLANSIGLTDKQRKKAIATGQLALRNQRNMNAATAQGSMTFSVFRSKLLLASFAVGLVAGTVGRLVRAFAEQEESEKRVEAALESTGFAAGLTAEEIFAMTSRMQDIGVVGDEVNNKLASFILTFTNIRGEAFEKTLIAANNMAISISGTVPGFEQLRGAATMLAKALQDPKGQLGALSRAGFTFSDSQKEMVKELAESGKFLEAQNIILEAAETQYGRLAEELRKTTTGAFAATANASSDAAEAIGEILAPNTVAALNAMEDFFKAIKDNQDTLRALFDTLKALGLVALLFGGKMFVLRKGMSLLGKAVGFLDKTFVSLKGVLGTLAAMGFFQYRLELHKATEEQKQSIETTAGSVKMTNEELEAYDKFSKSLADRTKKQKETNETKQLNNALTQASTEKEFELALAKKRSVLIERELAKMDKVNQENLRKEVEEMVDLILEQDKLNFSTRQRAKAIREAIKAQKDMDALLKKSADFERDSRVVLAELSAMEKVTTKEQFDDEEKRIKQLKEFGRVAKALGVDSFNLANAIAEGQTLSTIAYDETNQAVLGALESVKLMINAEGELVAITEKFGEESVSAFNKFSEQAGFAIQALSGFSQAQSQLVEERMAREMEALKASRAYEEASQEEREVMENRVQQRFKSQRRKAFVIQKASNIAEATMNVAQAYTKALATMPPPGNIPLAAFVAALGAAQVAAIAAQPAPRFATGGSFITTGPQNMIVGESGPERVTVQPLSGLNARQGGGTTQNININVSAPLVDETILDVIIPKIEEAGRLNLA